MIEENKPMKYVYWILYEVGGKKYNTSIKFIELITFYEQTRFIQEFILNELIKMEPKKYEYFTSGKRKLHYNHTPILLDFKLLRVMSDEELLKENNSTDE